MESFSSLRQVYDYSVEWYKFDAFECWCELDAFTLRSPSNPVSVVLATVEDRERYAFAYTESYDCMRVWAHLYICTSVHFFQLSHEWLPLFSRPASPLDYIYHGWASPEAFYNLSDILQTEGSCLNTQGKKKDLHIVASLHPAQHLLISRLSPYSFLCNAGLHYGCRTDCSERGRRIGRLETEDRGQQRGRAISVKTREGRKWEKRGADWECGKGEPTIDRPYL